MRLAGKVAIITGAGRGIGRETALRFAGEGASVVLANRNEENARQTNDNIRVNCVCPGRTATDMVEQHIAESDDPETARRLLSSDRPMLRMGTVTEIANAILFLASDEATYATGAVLAVDGGFTV